MKKQSIVIASILKPVDDTRMYEKMGQSLAATGQWQVHIIGFGERMSASEPDLVFHTLGVFPRISLARLLAPIKTLRKLFQIKPAIIVANTHELLSVSAIYRIFTGAKIFYDIRENYYLNIRNTNAFPFGIRFLISVFVRCMEWITSFFIHHFILAEKNYATELPFIGKKFTFVENKCKRPTEFKRNPVNDETRLLFTGTLDESTGIFEAIGLVKKLNALNPNVKLKIIGYCARPDVRKKILEATSSCSFITITGLGHLVEHKKIFDEISQATAGLIYYPPSPHTRHCTPTKLYEYLCCQLPIVYDLKTDWPSLITKCEGGIAIDFANPDLKEILKLLTEKKFYIHESGDASWQGEEERFLKTIEASLL